jgi:hypothetical protein
MSDKKGYGYGNPDIQETRRKALKATEIFLEEKLGSKVITVDLDGEELPVRGFGRILGTAKEPTGPLGRLSEEERKLRHGGSMVLIADPEVTEITRENPKLSFEDRIKAIKETPWAKNWAKGMCNLVRPEAPPEEQEKCILDMSEYLAKRAVS